MSTPQWSDSPLFLWVVRHPVICSLVFSIMLLILYWICVTLESGDVCLKYGPPQIRMGAGMLTPQGVCSCAVWGS
jgi:hypothetical protein